MNSDFLYADHEVQISNPLLMSEERSSKNLKVSKTSIVPEGDRWKIQTNVPWERTLKTCVLQDYKEENLILDSNVN